MRARLAVAVGAVATGSLAAVALGAPARSVVADDAKGDVGAAPDLTRFALRRYSGQRIRASLTLAESLRPGLLLAPTGPPGSLCVKLWTVSDPPDAGPDYLVCATAKPGGRQFRGSVLRERPNQLPERVATAKVTRPSARTLRMFFSQASIGLPAVIDAAAEATRAGCARLRCIDTAPNAPRTIRLRLRRPPVAHG